MSVPRASLRQLEVFLVLAEIRHFRRAAERLGVSQPTLTGQIAALERGLGTRLLERSHAGSLLTAAGRDLLPHARRVVEEHRGLLERARHLAEGPLGTWRLGITPTLGPYLLPHVLPDLHRRYTDLKLYVREDAPRDLEQGLLAGEHDLILTPLPVDAAERLTVQPLFREPLSLVLSADHRLAGRKRIRPEELAGEPVLALEEHHLFHRQVQQLCERLGAQLLHDYEGTSLDTLRHMVVMGMGVSFLPALYICSEFHQPEELHVTQLEGERMDRVHALVWRSSAPNPEPFTRLAADVRGIVSERLAEFVDVVPPALTEARRPQA